MSFLDVEGDYVRKKVLPDFEWTSFAQPTVATPLTKPINECRVALVVTAGAYLAESQTRFDNRNPFGDDSYRIIPSDTPVEQIALSHPGYDTKRALNGLDGISGCYASTECEVFQLHPLYVSSKIQLQIMQCIIL